MMRPCFSFLLPPTLLAAMLCPIPAFAQQPAPLPEATMPAPSISPSAPSIVASDPLLPIPAPPGAKLRVEMDARSEDLLGMIKSFLKGIGETEKPLTKTPSQVPAPLNPLAEALEAGNLADMLKDVNHVHFVVWELPGATPPPTPAFPLPFLKPHTKSAKTLPAPLPPSPAVPAFDSNAFYESAFAGEGAHRILYTDADDYKLVMLGFPDRHGFAFAVSGAGYVAVSRSDGYPNLESLTAFVSHITSAVMKSTAGQKILNDTLSTGNDSEKSDPGIQKGAGE